MINGKYKAQIIAMVGQDLKERLRAEATEREVSISQVIREHVERSIDLPDPDQPTFWQDPVPPRPALLEVQPAAPEPRTPDLRVVRRRPSGLR